MPRREELLKLKFDIVYRGIARDVAEERFRQIVSVTPPVASVPPTT
jgi:hypothetical protein